MRRFFLSLAICMMALTFSVNSVAADNFSWRGATVYFLVTDRFANGETSNDVNYGRKVDYGSEQMNAATFHGGDLKGILQKAREGYFTQMGIDVLWMTDVYEQLHGWIAGSGKINDFPHYGYHGYYPLDYTQMDKNYGTIEEMRELVNTLHAQGIRVMLGANLNDPGCPTYLDAVQCGYADAFGMNEKQAVEHRCDLDYIKWYGECANWKDWWTRQWIRMNDEGWDQTDPLTMSLYDLPDVKTEKTESVKIPNFLKKKWKREGKSNDAWVNPSARKLRKDHKWAPSDYMVAWIASWVEEFGIDGFRCDIVEYSHIPRWRQLYDACNVALGKWRKAHPEDPAAKWTDKIYFTGDFDYASIDYKKDYAEAGFQSMVNFYFPKHGDLDNIVYTWQQYADSLSAHVDWHPFSYLNNSYNRETDMTNIIDCATTLLLTPGVAQVFYGDETRRGLSDAQFNVDSNQAFRSDMNWNSIDEEVFKHFHRLGTIRKQHPTIATGRQATIDVHTCARLGEETVVIRVKPNPNRGINVSGYFSDGTEVTDLYTGLKSVVKDGKVSFPKYQNHVAVIVK